MSTLKEKTASGLFWAAMNNGSMQILNAVIGIFLARLLDPADYGLVGMITIFTAIAGCLQDSGFTTALINLKEPEHKDYNSVFWFSLLMGCSLYLLLFFCAPLIAEFYHQEKLTLLCRIAFLSLPLSAFGIVPQAYLSKRLIIKPVTIQRIVVLTISGITGITLALKGMGYWALIVQQLVYTGLQSFGKYFLMPFRPTLDIDFTPVKRMFDFSSKILITNIISQVSQNILTVIFGRIFPVKTVGNFTQGWKWNNMASGFVSGMLAQVAQPVFVSIQNEEDRQLHILRKMTRFTAFLAFPAMFGLAIIAPEFIVLLISDKWIDSVPILQILCISGAFIPIYLPMQQLIVSQGRSDIFMWANIAQIAIQIGVILIFAQQGIIAMVTAYSAFIALWTIVWQFFTKKIVDYRFLDLLKDLLPFLLSALAVCAIAYIVASLLPGMLLRMVAKIVIAVILYAIVMQIAGAQVMKECLGYLLHKKGKKSTESGLGQ
ncbi:lipopolysaccharide biosynthesis protein [Prevotella sp. AGR2160]|uniref:lipopolysaccharide biosynthesis protein n=1 Tax=Prevotella sp. AGR2160 TaxID=1280674 RepID=UPI0004066D7C|nr:lipopolysaccharide biosynthesis protein [Prevotella sp. AGR2160]